MLLTFFGALLGILVTALVYKEIQNWGLEFQFPVLRQHRKPSMVSRTVPEAYSWIAVTFFYLTVGFFSFYGLAAPLTPSFDVPLSSVQISIIAMMSVGILRLLTLFSSQKNFSNLETTIFFAFGLLATMLVWYPQVITDALVASRSIPGKEFVILEILAAGVGIALVTEFVWYVGRAKIPWFVVSEEFVNELQSANKFEEVGYIEKNIRNSYVDLVKEIAGKSLGIKQVVWVAAFGENLSLYQGLLDYTAAGIAFNRGAIKTIDGFFLLRPVDQTHFHNLAREHLKMNGKFLIYHGAKDGIEEFRKVFNFEPAKLKERPEVRFMILNHQAVITSWASHSHRDIYNRRNTFYGSTMYSKSYSDERIDYYYNIFEMYWAYTLSNSQFSKLAIVREKEPKAIAILGIIIDRASPWSVKEILEVCASRGLRYSKKELDRLIGLLQGEELIHCNSYQIVSRLRDVYQWQEQWIVENRNT